jgi:hypothetical protein
MRFIVGPRQAGKTTLACQKLRAEDTEDLYYLWDLRSVRQRYKANELFFTEDGFNSKGKLWVCFDELHKMPKWKNILKAVFDETSDHYQFIVTGSAKMNLTKRAGDSLAGRYFTFQLMPLILRELVNGRTPLALPPADANDFILPKMDGAPAPADIVNQLLHFGGFPEPFIHQSDAFNRKWATDYIETVIQEDIGALTRIVDRENLYELYNLLPEIVGSPLSESSLASHLQISPVTVKNYLRRLGDFYLTFVIRPYSKNIKRSLLKAGKHYLYNWSHIREESARFENYVACELMARLHLWRDASGLDFSLWYIRNKEKQETDFLVVRDSEPWLLVECKLSDGSIDPHHRHTSRALGDIPVVQVCRQEGIASLHAKRMYRMSASRLFA